MEIPPRIAEQIHRALEEDIGHGDITSRLLIPPDSFAKALYIAKENFVLAGMPFAQEVFRQLDADTTMNVFHADGSDVSRGTVIAEVKGRTQILLAGERVSLNILQRLSGIATLTSRFVNAVKGTRARIVDTRKTTPCMRFMEKYAVRKGGGTNHRFALYDGILIKDNHIEAVGSVREAVKRAKSGHYLSRVEVEVENLNELNEALEAGADVIMLDNMSLDDMKEAVSRAGGRVPLEASGNMNLGNVREVAETGVDFISVGSLTHSAASADISMKIIQ